MTRKVLLVDNCAEDRKTYCRYLSRGKLKTYTILQAETGTQALLLCRQQLPDAILLDYLLPDIDGLQLLNNLKTEFGENTPPIIILTGHGNEEIAVRAMKSGAADYLVKKNTKAANLRVAIENVLEQTKLSKEIEPKSLQLMLEELQVAEEELRSSNEELAASRKAIEVERQRYHDLFELAPNGYLVTDVWGNIKEANRAASMMLGVSKKYLIGKPLLLFIFEQERKSFNTRLLQLSEAQNWEVTIVPRSGVPLPVAIAVSSIYNPQGERVGLRWLLRDISVRKQMEQKLEAVREELEKRVNERTIQLSQSNMLLQQQAALLDITTDAIIVRNLENQILFWNQGAERLYGWRVSEALDKNVQELLHVTVPSQLSSAQKKVVEKGEWQGELNKITKSGKELQVQSRWTLVRDEAGQPKSILSVDTDITEKKQLEMQFYRAQRLESLGILASGIAHDLNNILTPILTIAQLLPLRFTNLDNKNKQLLEILEENSKRGAEIVKQILSFSRGNIGKPVTLLVENIIKELELIVKSTFPKSIEISIDIPKHNFWAISADPTQIHQVLTNLCLNARDAMPDGGILTISAENRYIDENYARMNLEAQIGNYVFITVSDTGCGIPKELLSRIGEPFFTTKEVGKGTGLGLSTVFGIIKNHGGFVNVASEVGKGSRFEVCLRACENGVTQESFNSNIAQGNGELIMIVDDEASIREITKTSLSDYNYEILTASSSIEAFSLYVEHQDKIALVLMDIQMPSVDGIGAIRVLQQINPSIKIIAISGLASNRQLLETNGLKVQAFLLKPYTIKDLLETIQNVLIQDIAGNFT